MLRKTHMEMGKHVRSGKSALVRYILVTITDNDCSRTEWAD